MFHLRQRWNFPSNNYGQILGIADSGVETFKGAPIKSLAREICQNSLDARLDNGQPTRVEFKVFELSPHALPDYEGLEDACKRALAFWSKQHARKAQDFFRQALDTLHGISVTCLRISDFNTTGLLGSRAEYNSPWCNLTKSSGASDKSGGTGGSFGIGKFAPYACSGLRTVFYSTDDNEGLSAAQGVARLTSFKNEEHEITQGIGFYGNDKNSPMPKSYSLDPQYARRAGDSGTDIFVLGFMHDQHWRDQMVASILDGFLYAIYTGALVVDVDGIMIRAETLPDLIVSYKDVCKEHADEYYQTLTDKKTARTFTRVFTGEDDIFGSLTLRLMIMSSFSRRVAMIRQTGMKIKDQGYIRGLIPFAGTMFIEGDSINGYLRSIENPQHLDWEVERADNKSKAKRLLKAFRDFIKDSLNEMKNDESEDSLDPDVGEYLSVGQAEQAAYQARTETLQGNIKEVQASVIAAAPEPSAMQGGLFGQALVDDDESDMIVLDLPETDAGGMAGVSAGSGGGGEADPIRHGKKLARIAVDRVRFIVRNKAAGAYRIVFTPEVSAVDGVLEVYMSAESQKYKAAIIAVACADCPTIALAHNRVTGLVFTEKQPIRIDIRLDYRDYCSLEVRAYGDQG